MTVSQSPVTRTSIKPSRFPSLPPAARDTLLPGRRGARKRGFAELKRRFARLNHVLIPDKKTERDRLRSALAVRFLGAFFGFYTHLSREGRALLVLTVPIGFAALDVRFSQTHLLFAMVVGLLVGSWLCRPLFKVSGLRVDVATPPRVAVGAPAHFDVQLSNHGTAALVNLRVAVPFLPWDGRWKETPEGVALLEPGQRSRVGATAVFQARGEHHLDSFEIGQLVSTGLAVGPRFDSVGVRFLVVPKIANVVSLGASAAVPQLDRGLVAANRTGETDIAGVRPYRIGDPLKHLHARTWARTGEPHVREFIDPRDERVALIVVTAVGEATELLKEAALSVASGVAARLTLHDRGLDLLVCDTDVVLVQPRSGQSALDVVLDRLATLELAANGANGLSAPAAALRGATSAIVVTAGAPVEVDQLVSHARQRGCVCTWAAVVDSKEDEAPESATLVEVEDVSTGKRIAL